MLYTAIVLLSGFYFGIGFILYLSYITKQEVFPYSTSCHVLVTLFWGVTAVWFYLFRCWRRWREA